MELEHRFELPVGVDQAWATLVDIEKVGPCVPGALLEHLQGDQFSGSVQLRIGRTRITYSGTGRWVEKDERRYRAQIEATGNAGGSSSTAAILVTATATPITASRTAVDLVTTLSLTGRPAKFGRNTMVEVGNKLISRFAECLSNKMAGYAVGRAELVDVIDPDEVAATVAAGAAAQAATPPEPVSLVDAAAGPLLKRVLPFILGILLFGAIRKLMRRPEDREA